MATKEEEEEVSMTIPLKSHISDFQFYISFFCPTVESSSKAIFGRCLY